MTTRCGGGTSAPKAGFPLDLALTAGNVASLFDLSGIPWLIPAIATIDIGSYVLSSFCAADPPAMPSFTAAEANAILKFQLGPDFDSALPKMPDLVANVLWDQYCRCTSGAFVPPTYPTQPSGVPTYAPPVAPTNAACATTGPRTVTTFSGPSFGLQAEVPMQYVRLAFTNTIVSAGGVTVQVAAIQFNNPPPSGPLTNLSGTTTYNLAPGVTDIRYVVLKPGCDFIRPDVTFVSGAGSSSITYQIDGYCSGAPPGATIQPCCPPDVATRATLDLILNLATLIQRQTASFGYVYGANHTGLSGNGDLDVAGLLGVSVDVTTLPSSYGAAAGDPEELFGLGFVTLGTADGWGSSRRIDHDGTLYLPPNAGVFTKVGYSLAPGVVVSIRELTREP